MSWLDRKMVLVLNRNWQAIDVKTPAQAFGMLAADVATALDIADEDRMTPTKWMDWIKLPVREGDFVVASSRGPIRIPTVVVCAQFSRVPSKRPRFSAAAIWARDGWRCQYTGTLLRPGEGNIDHVVPRSRGGRTNWENCVLASKRVNSRKANQLPSESGLKLIRAPTAPRELPATLFIRNPYKIRDWRLFLPHCD
ncbi:MAG: HNH endonuclease [Verrucomicrobiae bacterium]|nr:HNH endonuclease [Verrucomicrobiae bacterium]